MCTLVFKSDNPPGMARVYFCFQLYINSFYLSTMLVRFKNSITKTVDTWARLWHNTYMDWGMALIHKPLAF